MNDRYLSRRKGVLSLVLGVILSFSMKTTFGGDAPSFCPPELPSKDTKTTKGEHTLLHGSGLLWKIERNGTKPSYLFGTVHLEDRRVTELPPEVERALVNARSFTMEVEMHPAARSVYAESVVLEDGQKLRDHLDAEAFSYLANLLERDYEIPVKALASLKPWAVFTLLSRPRPITGRTLDAVLEEQARDRRIPVYGLESVEELVTTLDNLPADIQVAILKDTLCNYDQILQQQKTLVELYLHRDLAGMVALNSRAHADERIFEALMDRLLYRRNERMAVRMQERLSEGGAFFAVGALHLPGEQGMLHLLEAKGYRVVAVY